MKYILNDGSGYYRPASRLVVERFIRAQPDKAEARRKLREGEWLFDEYGFSVRRAPKEGDGSGPEVVARITASRVKMGR